MSPSCSRISENFLFAALLAAAIGWAALSVADQPRASTAPVSVATTVAVSHS